MLKKTDVDNVIVQADYMSGDRFTIASALKIDSKLGVIILAAQGDTSEANKMAKLYKQAGNGDNRVLINEVPCRSRSDNARFSAVRRAYKAATDPRKPRWLLGLVARGVRLQSATFGTKAVAQAFHSNAKNSRNTLRTHWTVAEEDQVGEWLGNKGFRTESGYVFLWVKEGQRTAEKSHHFTSILTWRILKERIQRETGAIPVAVGDDIGIVTTPSLVKFWENPDWKKIFATSTIPPRAQQLGLWSFIAKNYGVVMNIGMRSGAIEVPALMGIHTLYLEEKENQQAKRMAQWINNVPTYERQIVDAPPGIKQQVAWREQAGRYTRGALPAHLDTHSRHATGMKLGFKKPPGGHSGSMQSMGDEIKAFGGMDPFKLRESEFDSIIKWVDKCVRGTTKKATNLRTDPLRRDPEKRSTPAEIKSKLTGEKIYSSYSEMYTSKEYLKALDTLFG